MQKYYQNELRFNEVYSRNSLPDKIKDGAYVINLDEYSDIGSHWIVLYALNNNVTYFDSIGVEHIPKEVKKNYWKYASVMCGYSCIGFIGFTFKGKSLTDFTNLFSPNYFKKKSADIILNYF